MSINDQLTVASTYTYLEAFSSQSTPSVSWSGKVSYEGETAVDGKKPVVTQEEIETQISKLLTKVIESKSFNAEERVLGQALCGKVSEFQASSKQALANSNILVRFFAYVRTFFQSTFDTSFASVSFGMVTTTQREAISDLPEPTSYLSKDMEQKLEAKYPKMTYLTLSQLTELSKRVELVSSEEASTNEAV